MAKPRVVLTGSSVHQSFQQGSNHTDHRVQEGLNDNRASASLFTLLTPLLCSIWGGGVCWRFCRAQIVRVWTPTFAATNIFYRPRTFQQSIVTVVYYETRTSLTGRRYFMQAQIFHGCRHFMDADISWARTFHGREHFIGANILTGSEHFDWKRIFYV